MSTDAGWDDLVSTALLGTERRPLAPARLPAPVTDAVARVAAAGPRDAATTLLDTAALTAVFSRAGTAPAPAPPALTAAPAIGRVATGPAAARLGGLLAALDPDLRGSSGEAGGLMAQWLDVAAERGIAAAPAHLPALLALATRRPEFTRAVAAVLGPRGWWLAGLHEEWSRAVARHQPAGQPLGAVARDAQLGQDAWERGSSAQRRDWLTTLRATDPAAARGALLALEWKAEKGEDRAAFTDVLEVGLTPADEELLERARSDRRQDVRSTAERLLTRLPGSAYSQQITAAATACLRLERHLLKRTLVATLPESEPAPVTMTLATAPPGVGPAAWLLRHLIGATPPAVWQDALGLDAPALVALPVTGGLTDVVHGGWALAAARHQDPAWARALLPRVPDADRVPLLQALPAEERVAALIRQVQETEPSDRDALARLDAAVAAGPDPWPAPLADAVLSWLAGVPENLPQWGVQGLVHRAKWSLPPTEASVTAAVAAAERHPPDSPWHFALTDVAHTVARRQQILEELR